MSEYKIVRMAREEIDIAVEWAAREGWNPGMHDAQCFYEIDPNGFFVGLLDGVPIARASALIYDDNFAFCGFYIVDPKYRAHGYGLQLTKARLEYIGSRNAGLDGVVAMKEKYKRLGYKIAHNSIRYTFTPNLQNHEVEEIKALSQVSFSELAEYDRRHFFAPREAFLKCWISQPHSVALGFQDADKLRGYGVLRKCRTGFKIGPLFADQPKIAELLFIALCSHALEQPVFIDVPEPNKSGLQLAKKYGLNPVFECARMYLRGDPDLPLKNIYGITTFEVG